MYILPGTYPQPKIFSSVCRKFHRDLLLDALFVPADRQGTFYGSEGIANRFTPDVKETDVLFARPGALQSLGWFPAASYTPLHSILVTMHVSNKRYAIARRGLACVLQPGTRMSWLPRAADVAKNHVLDYWHVLCCNGSRFKVPVGEGRL